MQTKIYLIRHGKTAANIENRFAGRTNEPLHREGISQIEGFGGKLSGKGISRIVAGPLPRTRQTAEIIGAQLSLPVAVCDNFTEINIPHWDGLTKDAIRVRFGPQYPTWLDTPQDFSVNGCETIAHVQERAVAAMENLFADHQGETILVVSHLIVVRSLLLHYLGLPLRDFRSIKVDNGALSTLFRNGRGETNVLKPQ